jgi:hypothetical protein
MVPVVYEAAPLPLFAAASTAGRLTIRLSQAEAAPKRVREEAIQLCRRAGGGRMEAIAAFNLGNAYLNIPALRSPDHAKHWY